MDRAHRGDHESRVESARFLARDTTRRGPDFPCKEVRNETRQAHTYFPSARETQCLVLGNIAHYKVIEQEPRVLDIWLPVRFEY
jgi:hypothetical protein